MTSIRLMTRWAVAVALVSVVGGCDAQDGDARGELTVLTYNVAGLPQGLSGSKPVENMPQIGPKLNAYDLVLVQEDFWYHGDLDAAAEHPYRSEPMWEQPDFGEMGDGLNRFSEPPFEGHVRVAWEQCNGYFDSGGDCMTTKGFAMARHTLAQGIQVDVYNLHMDASGSEGDFAARTAQVAQLTAYIHEHSPNRAVLVAGDTNLKATRPQDLQILAKLLAETGLADACQTLDCGDERLDRVLLRGSDTLDLEALAWSLPEGFVDADGEPLSDHLPVAVTIGWTAR